MLFAVGALVLHKSSDLRDYQCKRTWSGGLLVDIDTVQIVRGPRHDGSHNSGKVSETKTCTIQ